MNELKELITSYQKPKGDTTGLPEPSLRKLYRQAAGLNQFQAAEIVSKHAGQPVSRARFANWELDLNAPSQDLLPAYREFLEACRQLHEEKLRTAKGSK
jgi:uncharacterized protein YfaT (DUF1175 family)